MLFSNYKFLKVNPLTPYSITISPKNFMFSNKKINIPTYAIYIS